MFVDSVLNGLKALTFWQFWAISFGVGFLGLIQILIIAVFASSSDALADRLGCLVSPLLFIFPSILMVIAIILLYPIIVLHRAEISLDLFQRFTIVQWVVMIVLGFAAIVVVSFIPFLGQLNSIPTFAQAATVLAVITYIISGGRAEIWPGIFTSIGLAFAGGILSAVVGFAFIALLMLVVSERVIAVLGQPIGLIPSLIAATMYGGWLNVANGL